MPAREQTRSMVSGAEDALLELIFGGLEAKAPFMEEAALKWGRYAPTRGEEIISRTKDEKRLQDDLEWIMNPNRDVPASQRGPIQGVDIQAIKSDRDKLMKTRNDIQKSIDTIQTKISKVNPGTDQGKAEIERLSAQKQREQERLNIVLDDYNRAEQTLQYAELGMTPPTGYMSIKRGAQKPLSEMSPLELATVPPGGGEVSAGTYGAPPGGVAVSPGPLGGGLRSVQPTASAAESLYARATREIPSVYGTKPGQVPPGLVNIIPKSPEVRSRVAAEDPERYKKEFESTLEYLKGALPRSLTPSKQEIREEFRRPKPTKDQQQQALLDLLFRMEEFVPPNGA